jgi:hypothetical protein
MWSCVTMYIELISSGFMFWKYMYVDLMYAVQMCEGGVCLHLITTCVCLDIRHYCGSGIRTYAVGQWNSTLYCGIVWDKLWAYKSQCRHGSGEEREPNLDENRWAGERQGRRGIQEEKWEPNYTASTRNSNRPATRTHIVKTRLQ